MIFNGSVFCFAEVLKKIHVYETMSSAIHIFCGIDIQGKSGCRAETKICSLSNNQPIILVNKVVLKCQR